MAKKKNKTIASTRKKPETAEGKQKKEEKNKKGIKKIITKYKKTKKPAKAAKKSPKVEKSAKANKKTAKQQEKRPIKTSTESQKSSEQKVTPAPKEAKELKPPRKPILTPRQRQKLQGASLIFIGAFALIFIGYFLFGKFFQPQPLAELMPEEGTLALLEINIDPAAGQTNQFYQLLKNYPVYQAENLITIVQTVLPVNYQQDVEPWLGRKAGVAIYGQQPIFLVESRNHDMTIQSLHANPAKREDGQIVYTGSSVAPGTFTFVNNYLVYSEDSSTMDSYLGNLNGTKVSDSEKYQKVRNNLSQGSLIFGYVDYGRVLAALAEDKLFTVQKGQDILALQPFLDVFRSAGFTVFAEGNRFTAQTFTSIDNTKLEDEAYLTFNEKYHGDLLKLADPAPILLAGGHDLTKELNRLEDVFKSGTKTPALVFDGILEAQKQTYFGDDIDLEQDIYPLLTGEYLMTVEGSFEDPVISVFLKLNDKNSQIPMLERAISEFVRTSGIFTPRIQEVTLPDGTVGKEIVASPEKIDKFEGTYNGLKYQTLQIGDTGKEINYVIQDDVAVFSTSDTVIKSVIDRSLGTKDDGYAETKYYENNIRQVLSSSDEILQVKLGAITEFLKLNDDKVLSSYLVPFTNFTAAKNFFTDGISTVYLIEVI